MPEELIVQQCSPTLAGLKTGNLFTCAYQSEAEMLTDVRQLNQRLVPKGLRILPLRFVDCRALIYLYRPARLKKDLANQYAEKLLQSHGYSPDNSDRCVAQLIKKLRTCPDFPHEIGLFLGYPPEDVQGFIENKAACAKCIGCWKVYGDAEEAQRLFDQYKKCTDAYCAQWAQGKSIEHLIVAG